MDYSTIPLKMEQQLSEQLSQIIHGDIISAITREAQIEEKIDYWKQSLEGDSLKVTKELTPDLYCVFCTALERLGFEEPIEFYICNSAHYNAYARPRISEDLPHLIVVHSALINQLDDDEMIFVIGHEIGHLISKNSEMNEVLNFVFPEFHDIPLLLQHKIMLWRRLSELTADRFGYIACPKLEKVISGFFKLSSGLNPERVNLDLSAYLKENDKNLKSLKEDKVINIGTHPMNPIRIKGVEIFSKSKTFMNFSESIALTKDEQLEESMSELCNMLSLISNSAMDNDLIVFFATGGFLIAQVDNQVSEDEYKEIITALSNYTMFPEAVLDNIIKNAEDPIDLFRESITNILSRNPSAREGLFSYLVHISVKDKQIKQIEIELLFDIATKMLEYSRKEAAQIMASIIQRFFIPEIYDS